MKILTESDRRLVSRLVNQDGFQPNRNYCSPLQVHPKICWRENITAGIASSANFERKYPSRNHCSCRYIKLHFNEPEITERRVDNCRRVMWSEESLFCLYSNDERRFIQMLWKLFSPEKGLHCFKSVFRTTHSIHILICLPK